MADRNYDTIRGARAVADLGPAPWRNAIIWIVAACVAVEIGVILYGIGPVREALGGRYSLLQTVEVAHGLAAERLGIAPIDLMGEAPRIPGRDRPAMPVGLRLLTTQFVHGGLLHLGMNMIALFYLAPPVLRRMGSLNFMGFYLICGIVGALAYALPRAALGVEDAALGIPLVGASGAILGVWLANLRIIWDRLRRMPPAMRPESPGKYMRKILIMIVMVNVAFVLIPTGIAGEAHIGGAIAGFLLYPIMVADETRRRYRARLETYVQRPLGLSIGRKVRD